MFDKTLAPKTKKLLHALAEEKWISDFYLAGGTALALQYGHRQSVDLDWFTQKNIQTASLLKKVSKVGAFVLLNEEANTLEGIFMGVKTSFITYPYPLLQKTVPFQQNVQLADPLDIAVMKVGAIARRNTRKDFIDLFCFLHKEGMSLEALLRYTKRKFRGTVIDRHHIYKSLMYFTEADTEPMPVLFEKITWKETKNFFVREVRKIAKD